MPWPVQRLPLVQNWDCHGCGECCREYHVTVTDAERERILAQGWEDDPHFAGTPLFIKGGSWRKPTYRLNTRSDNTCIFLKDDGRCRIHEKFGGETKPLACRIYPYVLIPAGNHWRVGIRFACPSAAANRGRPLAANIDELREFARALESRENLAERPPDPPPVFGRQRMSWDDLEHLNRAVLGIFQRPDSPIEYRLRLCLALDTLCRSARLNAITGPRLTEFLDLVVESLSSEVERDPERIPAPGWIGRILFRQAAALYARRDTGPRSGVAARGRIALLRAAFRFARGAGRVPQVHGLMPATTFEELEKPRGPLSAESEALLTRYFQVKIESMHFFGPTNFRLPFWDGLESLLLTYPVTMWLARAFANQSKEDALMLALRIVDDNFSYNKLLGFNRQRLATRTLASRGELARLIAWYSR